MTQANRDLKNYKLYFKFYRTGLEYNLNGVNIHIEDIEHLKPSVEVVSESEKAIDDLFSELHIKNRISDSVPKLVERELIK